MRCFFKILFFMVIYIPFVQATHGSKCEQLLDGKYVNEEMNQSGEEDQGGEDASSGQENESGEEKEGL